jgi:hypothetical protein
MRIIGAVIFSGYLATNAQAEQGEGGTNNLSIGERVWPPISTGVLFVDGKYIPPPYVVSRRESDVFISGHKIAWVLQWPPKKRNPPPPPPTEKPTMPASITENTTRYDKNYLAYTSRTRQYLIAKYGEEKGIELMVGVYRVLPCIQSAQLEKDDPHVIEVIWTDGSRDGFLQIPPKRKEPDLTKEQAEKYIDSMAEIFVRGLSRNSYYMLEGGGPSRSGSWIGAKQTFLPIADAINATKDEEEYLSVMKTNQPPGGMSEKILRSFYKYKDELPNWEPRLRAKESRNAW